MEATDRLRANLHRIVDELDLRAPPVREPIPQRRRRRARGAGSAACELVITRRDGVLFMHEAAPPVRFGGGRRRARQVSVGGEVVERIPLARLPRSRVVDSIRKLDYALTGSKAGGTPERPSYGLRRIRLSAARKAETEPVDKPAPRGQLLLFVHGTFSHTETILDELLATKDGRLYLGHVLKKYDEVLCFDHPTLSVSPWLNARELQLRFQESSAKVDVICHSRGGLVTRWWLEALDRRPPDTRRAMFVGSPLCGTSLASPPKLPAVLNLLLNLAHKLDLATAAASYLAAATGIFQILSSALQAAGTTNRIDAAVAVIPGLAAQSRTGNNPELESLRQRVVRPERYFAVQSNFEPRSEGWKFWRYFCNWKSHLADWAIDPIFDGPNDLVVDTVSMADLTEAVRLPAGHVRDFEKNSRVYHTNYFRQPETIAFFREKGF